MHHHLTHSGQRCDANIIVATCIALDAFLVVSLIGYGAFAVYPFLSYFLLNQLIDTRELLLDTDQADKIYRRGVNKGLLKIISKMGISTISSYRGAQLFEAIGLADEVVELCFTGTPSRLQGAGFAELELDQKALAKTAWQARKPIAPGGLLKYMHGQEYHAFNPDVGQTLQRAVQTGDYALWRDYASLERKSTRPHSR